MIPFHGVTATLKNLRFHSAKELVAISIDAFISAWAAYTVEKVAQGILRSCYL